MILVQCDCFDCDVKCANCKHSGVHDFSEECMKRHCEISMVIVECVEVEKD